MEILEAILICFVISGIIIFIAYTIMNLWLIHQDNVFYEQWKKYSKRTELIHFPSILGNISTKYIFRNCNKVVDINIDDIGDCNGKF